MIQKGKEGAGGRIGSRGEGEDKGIIQMMRVGRQADDERR